jgi:hypothetical protein
MTIHLFCVGRPIGQAPQMAVRVEQHPVHLVRFSSLADGQADEFWSCPLSLALCPLFVSAVRSKGPRTKSPSLLRIIEQSGYAAAISSHPEPPLAIFRHVIGDYMAQAVASVVVREAVAIEARETLEGAEPEIAFLILIDRSDGVVRQSVGDIIPADGKLLGLACHHTQPKQAEYSPDVSSRSFLLPFTHVRYVPQRGMISATDASVPVFGLIYENSSALKNGGRDMGMEGV